MIFMEFPRQIRHADGRRRKYFRDVASPRFCNAGYTTISQPYFAGAGCLKTGTPSTRSSSASAPSVGRTFT
jgi:hypothetical protein